MKNLNDIIYDYNDYSIYWDRNHSEFIVDDSEIETHLIPYIEFEQKLINSILSHQRQIYLRFCDGEFMYYKNNILKDFFIKIYRYFRGRDKTCWWEKADTKLLAKHFDFFSRNKDIVNFFPHISKSYSGLFKETKLRDYLHHNKLYFWHFYYIYHFLNKLRQHKIDSLKNINIVYITHNAYIDWLDHYSIPNSYTQKDSEKLSTIDFSHYDLILLWGWIASPLWADAIKNCNCPIIDSWYILSMWGKKSNWINDRVFTWVL